MNFKKIKTKLGKNLIIKKHFVKGRNNEGKITVKHRGGGHKKLYRVIDFKRNKFDIIGIVKEIQYDPNRNVLIALIKFNDNEYRYILAPEKLKIGMKIESGFKVSLRVGNCLPLKNIPCGYKVHNIEFKPNHGGKLARSAGCYAIILAKFQNFVTLKLPSKEIKLINKHCLATIGQLSNINFFLKKLKKAGQNRWLGIRPKVRGTAMNAVDHPHGGGKGKAPIGKKRPCTPWGKPTLGIKTRSSKKVKKFFIK